MTDQHVTGLHLTWYVKATLGGDGVGWGGDIHVHVQVHPWPTSTSQHFILPLTWYGMLVETYKNFWSGMLVESLLSKKQIVWGHSTTTKKWFIFPIELRNEEGFPNGTAACKRPKRPWLWTQCNCAEKSARHPSAAFVVGAAVSRGPSWLMS